MEIALIQPENTQTQLANQTYVTFQDFDVGRLSCTTAEQKPVPGTGQSAVPPTPPAFYYQIPLMYNFGTDENRILNEFFLEACEIETKVGIQSKPNQQGRMEHSIMCKFDSNNEEHDRFINTINHVHGGCCYIIQQMRGTVKLYDFNANAPGGLFKSPIYRPRDEITGDYIQGRAPSMFLKLFSRGQPPYAEQTLFTDLNEKPVPWELLRSVEMKFIPLIHVKRIYCGGGKASLQMEVASAIITKIIPRNTTTRQLGTIHRLRQNRPELSDTVAAQLAKITIDRQDQMLGGNIIHDHQADDAQPTFAGIAPTTGRQMQQITAAAASPLPNIPALGGSQPTMQDFTAAAPTRPPVIPTANIPGVQNGSNGVQGTVLQFS